jgi:hypothetical protein
MRLWAPVSEVALTFVYVGLKNMLQFYFSHYKKCGRSSLSLVKQFYVIDIFPFSHFFFGGGACYLMVTVVDLYPAV